MSVENLDSFFHPNSIAVIGASDREGSVGYIVFENLRQKFKGKTYPVNNKRDSVQGVKAFHSILDAPNTELAILCIPSEFVEGIVEECGKAGVKAIIIITAGFSEMGEKGRALLQSIDAHRKKYGMRIIGPNCLGVIKPSMEMNASFAKAEIPHGNVAFISQSGALGCAILDWSQSNTIGMSSFVSIGSMMDVDFGDLIEYFDNDPDTGAIFLYVESITDVLEFVEKATAFCSKKPIFAIKSGREVEGAKAAASHTGALAGEDSLYDASFRRAGIVRVDTTCEFTDLFEAVSLQPLPKGNRLIIITNAGGPGVMATDYLVRKGGTLGKISQEKIQQLNEFLPPFWSHSNPVDILGDAADDRYVKAFDSLLEDESGDGLLVILTPQAMTKSTETARALVDRAKGSKKPVFASWMGEGMVEEAKNILLKGGIPIYDTPEEAINSFLSMHKATENSAYLNLPSEGDGHLKVDVDALRAMLSGMAKEGRKILSETESKQLLEKYGIKTTLPWLANSPEEAVEHAKKIGYPVVMKIQSEDISHKSDANCVMLDVRDEGSVRRKYEEIIRNAQAYNPSAKLEGITIQKMISEKGFEVILGSKRDALFGPAVLFGMGGIAVEAIKDTSLELAPLTRKAARQLIGNTKVSKLLQKGFRNLPAANMACLEDTAMHFSQLVSDLPEIKEIDINPLRVDDKECIVLDARVVLNN